MDDAIRTTLFSFHVDTSCIQRARDLKYGRKRESVVSLPSFDGKVFVPPEVRSETSFKTIAKPQDIEWILRL